MCIQIRPLDVMWRSIFGQTNSYLEHSYSFIRTQIDYRKLQIRKCAFNFIYGHEFQQMCIQFSTISWVNACWVIISFWGDQFPHLRIQFSCITHTIHHTNSHMNIYNTYTNIHTHAYSYMFVIRTNRLRTHTHTL